MLLMGATYARAGNAKQLQKQGATDRSPNRRPRPRLAGRDIRRPGETDSNSFIIVERHVDTANEQPQRLGNYPIMRIHFPQRD